MTLVFMIAASNRLPRSTMKPASSISGRSNGRMTRSSSIAAPRQFSPMRAAVDGQRGLVDQALLHQLVDDRRHAAGAVVILAEIFAGRLQIHQQRHLVALGLPVGEFQRDAGMCRAMAARWIGALVDPPIAELTTIAFRNASRVRMSEGFRSSAPLPTMRLPVR